MPLSGHGLDWFSQHVIEILPAALYVCNAEGVIVAFNRRATELWGRSPATGQTDEKFCGSHKLFTPEGTFLPHHETPMAWVLRTGKPELDQEAIIEHPDGVRVPVLFNIAPLFDETGKQIGAVNCFQDLTAQKDAEKVRVRLNDSLRQAQKMEAVGQLTGGLAHDFNNLLAGISGNLELLRIRFGQGKVADLDRYLAAAQSATRRAAALTHRLLAFSRQQTLEVTTININPVVSGMEELIDSTVGSEINIDLIFGAYLWATRVDVNQLENALLNLCINSRDALTGGGTITVETANCSIAGPSVQNGQLPAGDYVSLCVKDTGAGMTAEVASRAFEPFFTTKPLGLGTGLGLSMIYGFAKQSGGHAEIQSAPGKGTAVTLYLPRAHVVDMPAMMPTPLKFEAEAHEGATILVVDDESMMRTLIAEVLEGMGHIVIGVADAAAAMRVLLSTAAIDLLIADIGLPGGMNGYQLTELARRHRPNLKVLFVTGYVGAEPMIAPPMDNDTQLLAKPFALSALASRVKRLVAVARDETSERKPPSRAPMSTSRK